MRVLVAHQPNYLPWLGMFSRVAQADVWVLADDVQYSKGGLINRNRIRTAQGWQWLSVPVRSRGRLGQRIGEVEIVAESSWARKHWETLRWNYRQARYFDHYADELAALYEQPWTHLLDLNRQCIAFLLRHLGLEVEVRLSSELALRPERTLRLVDMVRSCQCQVYLAGQGASCRYLEVDVFAAAGVQCRFSAFEQVDYAQCHPGFVAGMSALDLLLNYGPEAGVFLRQAINKTPLAEQPGAHTQ